MNAAAFVAAFVLLAGIAVYGGDEGRAERRLGMIHYRGEGVPVDHGKALAHLARAVEQGAAVSAIRLGKMHEYGMGIRPSVESAEAKLTARELSEGRERARAWHRKPS